VFKNLYSLNVFYTSLEGINNEALVDLSIQSRQNHVEKGKENTPLLDANNTHIKLLRDSVKRIIHKEIDSRLEEKELWAHVTKSGETIQIHNHKNNSDWGCLAVSWVYYSRNPYDENGGGKIVFQTQIGGTKTINRDFVPKEGDLIIVPGFLQHFTTTNPSPITRVSISGNYRIPEDNKLRYTEIVNDPKSGIKKLTGFY
jgi:hypothetical protein